jgi:beta-mannosidase
MNRRTFNKIVGFGSISSVISWTQASAEGDTKANRVREERVLSGTGWHLGRFRPGQGEQDGAHQPGYWLASWLPARVPGDVHSMLLENGAIPDPYYGTNFEKVRWIEDYEWWYRKTVDVPAGWKSKAVNLVFDGLDFIADVWANGQHLGHHEGMFSPARFDVTSLVRSGNSPHLVIAVRLEPPPQDRRLIGGRKCNLAYGIDYSPQMLTSGIWKDVSLVATEGAYLDDVWARSEIDLKGDSGEANRAVVRVGIRATVDASGRRPETLVSRVRLRGATFAGPELAAEVPLRAAADGTSWAAVGELVVDKPHLWWPWDLGRPDLYQLTVELMEGDSKELLDTRTERIGVCEVHRVPNQGAPPDAEPWQFVVNGRKTFLRGACWTNVDLFPGRLSEARYERLLRMARDANMNALRVHGWHIIETEAFYRRCDELGLLVWQELAFANIVYPQDESFIATAAAEVAAAIRTVRNHSSLILLCGGNEFPYAPNRALMDRMEQVVRKEAPDRIWTPVSPTTQFAGRNGDSHSQGVLRTPSGGFKPVEYWATDMHLFTSEFSGQSPPSVEALRRFLPPDQVWPPGRGWEAHFAQLAKLNYYTAAYAFNDPTAVNRFQTVEEYVTAAQAAQAYGLKYAIEHYRRRRGASGGCLFWEFNEPWPAIVWSVVDYDMVAKPAYEAIQQAYAPLQLNLAFPKRWWKPGETFRAETWAVNDYYQLWPESRASVRLLMDDQAPGEWTWDIDVPAASVHHLGDIAWVVPEGKGGFEAELDLRDKDGTVLAANRYVFALESTSP